MDHGPEHGPDHGAIPPFAQQRTGPFVLAGGVLPNVDTAQFYYGNLYDNWDYSTFLGRNGIYLEDLFIKPEYRNKGYGKALLIHLARLANQRGCGRFEWSVLDWNTPSIEFYRALGAKPLDDWTMFRLDGEELAGFGKA